MTTAGGIPGLAPGVSGPIRSAEATAHRVPRTVLRSPEATAHRAPRTFLLWCLLAAAGPASAQVPPPGPAPSALQHAVQQNPGSRRAPPPCPPLRSGPVPPDYKLGAGDQLVLILTGDVELAYTLPVTREGFILIPQVGQVFVSNLTLDQLRDVLFARLGRVYSGVRRGANASTRFDISGANVRANQVYVVGE